MTHAERVRTIAERFNAMLALFRLGPLESYADNRNIYKNETELAYEVGGRFLGGVLLLRVPDALLEGERNLLDYHLGEAITRNLKELA